MRSSSNVDVEDDATGDSTPVMVALSALRSSSWLGSDMTIDNAG